MSMSCGCCVYCPVEVSAVGQSLVQRSPADCDVSYCDREASIMRPCSIRGCCALTGGGGAENTLVLFNIYLL
jgi:hypothetical protein